MTKRSLCIVVVMLCCLLPVAASAASDTPAATSHKRPCSGYRLPAPVSGELNHRAARGGRPFRVRRRA